MNTQCLHKKWNKDNKNYNNNTCNNSWQIRRLNANTSQ